MRRIRTTTLALVTLLAVGLAACGGGGGSDAKALQPMPAAWTAAGKARVDALIARSNAKSGETCAPTKFLSPAALDSSRARYDWRIAPTAAADCDRAGETLEYVTYNSASDRDRFIDERTTGLCTASAATGAQLPPFAWVKNATGDAWSVQADLPATAKTLAKVLGGETDVRRCRANDTLGWTKAAIAKVRDLGAAVVGVNVPCSGFRLLTRDAVTQGVKGIRTPAVVAACAISTPENATGAANGAPAQTMVFATFDAKSEPRDQFLEEALTGTAACRAPATAVVGKDFAIIGPTEYAAKIAEATGGTVGRSCG